MNSMLDINNRSRILATTRSKDAVDSCMNSTFDKVHELEPLTFEKSMDSFARRHSVVTTMDVVQKTS